MRVYSAPVLAQVTHIKHVLETHGIECHLQGEYQRRGTEPRADTLSILSLDVCKT